MTCVRHCASSVSDLNPAAFTASICQAAPSLPQRHFLEGSTDVKLFIEEEDIGMNTSTREEVQKYEGGPSLSNASATAPTAEKQDPTNVGLLRGSLLHIAAATGNRDILRLLLSYVDANLIATRDDWGNTPLHIATKAKAFEVADMLIRRARDLSIGEDKNWILRIKNNHGNTALHEAVLTRDVGLVRHLLGEDLEPVYWENEDKKSPLYLALDTGNSDILRVLLSPSLDPSRIEGLPLALGAVARKQYGSLDEILKKNKKLFAMTDSKGGNVFHLAAFLNEPRIFDLLRPETEYLVRERDTNGDLPIHIASKMGHVELIEKLHSVSPWLNGQGQTILHVVAKYGREKAVRYIIGHPNMREMINERDHDGNTPLHLAVIYLRLNVLIHLVLDENINPSLLNRKGLAAVDIALNHPPRGLRSGFEHLLLLSVSAESSDLIILKPEARDRAYANRSLPIPDRLREGINTSMVVATLVTTVTFAAGFAVPGGFISSDTTSKDDWGMATMLDNRMFQAFVICNTIAMFCSMTSVVGFMLAYLTEVRSAIVGCLLAGVPLAIALPAMSAAFLIGVTLTIGKFHWLATAILILGSVFILIITGAILSPVVLLSLLFLPFFVHRLRPIRPLTCRFFLAYLRFLQVGTFNLDDPKEDRTGSMTSASPPLDGGDGD
ncbi:protein ACCELERATED CELL DEATH 6 isoform X2 [Eucalyptus grandis]|nr:protein ACCELERATED CELL DEATH 6 isoform X2 [Eucalyptus grandis]